MPATLDVALTIAFAAVVVHLLYIDKRLKAQVAAGAHVGRRRAYSHTVAGEWALTALVVAAWAGAHRPWSTLGLVPPQDWHLIPGALIPALIAYVAMRQSRVVRRLGEKRRAALRERLGPAEFFMPHTPAEYRYFLLLSVTAGVCEELLYRGFLTWLVASYVGLPAAVGIVTVAFALSHGSQERTGMIKVGLVGLTMSLIVLLTGWLIPAMIVHTLIDVSAGDLAFTVYDGRRAPAISGSTSTTT